MDNAALRLPRPPTIRNRYLLTPERRVQAIDSIKTYYHLTKPGIIRGNLIAASAGFLFAAKGNIDYMQLAGLIVGTSAIIASGCVFNNFIDRNIDKEMSRTKKRALVIETIKPQHALIFASFLAFIGSLSLLWFVNILTFIVGFVGFVDYVFVYAIAKRKTIHGTLVGSIAGAVPPVAGYSAVTNRLDSTAALLFLILVFWQMAHFFAIAMYRKKDYAAAGLPVISVQRSSEHTKKQILFYIAAYTVSVSALTTLGRTGSIFVIVNAVINVGWLFRAVKQYNLEAEAWGKSVFLMSLISLSVFCLSLSLDWLLP